jgi:hypothetical protein
MLSTLLGYKRALINKVIILFVTYKNICFAVGDPIFKRGRVRMPLTDLTPPYCCACPKLGPEFPTSYVMTFSMFNDLR